MWTKEQLEEMGLFEPIEQAAFLAGCFQHSLSNNGDASGYIVSGEKLQKLGELVVQECCQHLTNTGNDHAREILEKHFALKVPHPPKQIHGSGR